MYRRCTRQGLKVMPCFNGLSAWLWDLDSLLLATPGSQVSRSVPLGLDCEGMFSPHLKPSLPKCPSR